MSDELRRAMLAAFDAEAARLQEAKHLLEGVDIAVLTAASELFGSQKAAALWLATPAPGLGGRVPLAVAQTPAGAAEVLQWIMAIEHGVYL